jgi:hypothetical protein
LHPKERYDTAEFACYTITSYEILRFERNRYL